MGSNVLSVMMAVLVVDGADSCRADGADPHQCYYFFCRYIIRRILILLIIDYDSEVGKWVLVAVPCRKKGVCARVGKG